MKFDTLYAQHPVSFRQIYFCECVKQVRRKYFICFHASFNVPGC